MAVKMSPRFITMIKKERDNILKTSGSSSDYQAALARIRDSYDKNFGKSSKKRNIISLFLFAGPTSSRIRRGKYIVAWKEQTNIVTYCHGNIRDCILYTGDGYLHNKGRLEELTSYLGQSRIQRIGCLQVMHHGARGCWHKGVASALSPSISVFSSDPNRSRPGHPTC